MQSRFGLHDFVVEWVVPLYNGKLLIGEDFHHYSASIAWEFGLDSVVNFDVVHCYNILHFLEKVKGWREVFSESYSQVVNKKGLTPRTPRENARYSRGGVWGGKEKL